MPQKVLVLDLDECLVHSKFSKEEANGDYDFECPFTNHSGVEAIAYVRKRPFLDQFMEELSKLDLKEVCVFTAGIESYANSILSVIDPKGIVTRRFYRKDCVFSPTQLCYKKDLKLVFSDLSQVVLVDNSPMCFFTNQLKNGIPVSSFTNDKKDRELIELVIPVLRIICESETVFEPVSNYKQVFLQMLTQKRFHHHDHHHQMDGYTSGQSQQQKSNCIPI
jgi:Dullard-like phosphatase family protein